MEPVTIIGLHEENVMRIKLVEVVFDPERKVLILGGKNRQGKTSLIEGLAACLGGLKLCPEAPLREGTARGMVSVTLSNGLTVKRVFGKGEGLYITGPDGKNLPSPQAILDALWAAPELKVLAFDPVAFVEETPLRQQEVVKELVGLTDAFKMLDAQRGEAFDARTQANREIKATAARLVAMPAILNPKDVPTEEVNIQALINEAGAAGRANAETAAARNAASAAIKAEAMLQERVEALRKALADAEATRDRGHELANKLSAATTAMKDVDLGPISKRLAEAETVNKQVRSMKQRAAIAEALVDAKDISDANTRQIEKIDARKAELLSGAKMPVAGLAFTEAGMTLNRLPIKQASDAEKLELALGVAIGLTPNFRLLLVRRGSHLDDDALLRVCEVAQERQAQMVIERIGDVIPANIADKVQTVILEDGTVAAAGE